MRMSRLIGIFRHRTSTFAHICLRLYMTFLYPAVEEFLNTLQAQKKNGVFAVRIQMKSDLCTPHDLLIFVADAAPYRTF